MWEHNKNQEPNSTVTADKASTARLRLESVHSVVRNVNHTSLTEIKDEGSVRVRFCIGYLFRPFYLYCLWSGYILLRHQVSRAVNVSCP